MFQFLSVCGQVWSRFLRKNQFLSWRFTTISDICSDRSSSSQCCADRSQRSFLWRFTICEQFWRSPTSVSTDPVLPNAAQIVPGELFIDVSRSVSSFDGPWYLLGPIEFFRMLHRSFPKKFLRERFVRWLMIESPIDRYWYSAFYTEHLHDLRAGWLISRFFIKTLRETSSRSADTACAAFGTARYPRLHDLQILPVRPSVQPDLAGTSSWSDCAAFVRYSPPMRISCATKNIYFFKGNVKFKVSWFCQTLQILMSYDFILFIVILIKTDRLQKARFWF